jgi:hypothetical protein
VAPKEYKVSKVPREKPGKPVLLEWMEQQALWVLKEQRGRKGPLGLKASKAKPDLRGHKA